MKSQHSCDWRYAALSYSAHVKKLAWASSPSPSVTNAKKNMTAVGDTLSAARDIGTSARIMCMVTSARDCAAFRNRLLSGGLIASFRFIGGALVRVAASFVVDPLWRGARHLLASRPA